MELHEDEDFEKNMLASALLDAIDICPLEAAKLLVRLSRQIDQQGKGSKLDGIRTRAKLGVDILKQSESSVTFNKAVKTCISIKKHRRERTLEEIRYFAATLMEKFPELGRRKMRMITSSDCRSYIEEGFATSRQRRKARVILHGIFNVALKRGWCTDNPVASVEMPVVIEQSIESLNLEEVRTLLRICSQPDHRPCMAALGLMMYAGIRPYEVLRLKWKDINFNEKVVTLTPKHSKTGGTRHVSILPPLEKVLKYRRGRGSRMICPLNWEKRWRNLRYDAGWNSGRKKWQQDCLRHTFASYHAKHFRDYEGLQYEMGHGSSDLLRTRYLNMRGITQQSAEEFWTMDPLQYVDMSLPDRYRKKRCSRKDGAGSQENLVSERHESVSLLSQEVLSWHATRAKNLRLFSM